MISHNRMELKMKKLMLVMMMILMPSLAIAGISQAEFDAHVDSQAAVDTAQDVYSVGLDDAVTSNAEYFKESVERLDGAIAINAANSSIYMPTEKGISVGVGVGMYNDAAAISGKVAYISKNGEDAVSFNVGVSTEDSKPVVGLGVSHSF